MDLKEKTSNAYRHPWEISRAENIFKICRKLLGDNNGTIFADIGAGDMYFANKLCEISGSTIYAYAVDTGYVEKIQRSGNIVMFNSIDLLEDSSVDCIVMMDVLEHVNNDREFVDVLIKKLNVNGFIISTVPAFQFLFSDHDVFLNHYRRYNKKQLLNVFHKNNIVVIRAYYFYTCLFIARCLQVVANKIITCKKTQTGVGNWKYDAQSIFTRLVKLILNVDFAINKLLSYLKISLCGLSCISIFKKNK